MRAAMNAETHRPARRPRAIATPDEQLAQGGSQERAVAVKNREGAAMKKGATV